jgi:hypothetical protein
MIWSSRDRNRSCSPVSRRSRGRIEPSVPLRSIAGGMAVFAVLTYLTGIHALYSSVTPPALPTAVGLLCVAGAIVLRVGTMPALL